MSDDVLERLRAVDSCAVSDALDQLHLASGAALGISSVTGHHRVVGRVVTVRLVPVGEVAPTGRHLGTAAVESSGAGDVIVVDNGGRLDVAGWGGTLSRAAVRRGVGAVIVDGACRDIDETRELGLPMFAKAAVPRTARGRILESGWNLPVAICGIEVSPGDFVVADASGVVFVPADAAADVVAAAERIADRERLMAEQVDRGVPISEVMGADYESMLKATP